MQQLARLALLLVVLALVFGLVVPAVIRTTVELLWGLREPDGELFLGLVSAGELRLTGVTPDAPAHPRLTKIAMQEAQSPESAEIDLTPHNGRFVVLSGHDGGGWIYGAHIERSVGRDTTVLLRYAYGVWR